MVALAISLSIAAMAYAQFGYGRGRRPPPMPVRPQAEFGRPGFSFCRLYYDQVRYEELGQGWFTDYPESDVNLMWRLSQVTKATIRKDKRGQPDHLVVSARDEQLFSCPFLFVSDGGTIGFSEAEIALLRDYLLRGGFLWADDFWGDEAFEHFTRQIGRMLPIEQYPIVDVPPDHPYFHVLFSLPAVPQVPSIQFWRWSGGQTSERGSETAEPHLRAIFDSEGRPMVLMSHNTDIADGWEREAESDEFFERFSIPASYPLGINVVLYTLMR
jgi:Domain of unknown function (DUF4159)